MSRKRSRKERRFRAVQQLEDVEIRVQNPCAVSWGAMKGDQFVRICPICQLNVYNFATLSPDEIVALINQHEGKLCAQFYARSDGTMTIEHCDDRDKDIRMARGGLGMTRLTSLPPDHPSRDEAE